MNDWMARKEVSSIPTRLVMRGHVGIFSVGRLSCGFFECRESGQAIYRHPQAIYRGPQHRPVLLIGCRIPVAGWTLFAHH